jgi:adenylate cyclase
VRITTQLIDVTTDHHLWSERYDRSLKDIFAVQDEVVQKVVMTLKLQITLREQGTLVHKTTDNLEAYDYYLRGVEAVNRYTKEANAQARQLFEKALELDPQYAQAYASLGFTYFVEWAWQWNPDPQNLERAFARAQQAVALDDTLPQVHTTLGLIYLYKKQFEPAKAEFERAIALDPNFANAYVQLGSLMSGAGQLEEGVRLMEKGIRLNPRQPPPIQLNFLGLAYIGLGRYEEGIAVLKRALSLDPNLLFAHVNLAAVYSELGRDEEARAEVATVLRLNPQFSLEGVKQTYAVKDPAQLERYLAALRRAGLK